MVRGPEAAGLGATFGLSGLPWAWTACARSTTASSAGVERTDLAGGEAPLASQRREVRDARGTSVGERRGCSFRLCFERLRLLHPCGQCRGEAMQLVATVPGICRGARALVGATVELVQARDRVVERRGTEQDGDRVRLALLVEQPQAVSQEALRGRQIVPDDRGLFPDELLLVPQHIDLPAEALQLPSGVGEARVEGEEAEQSLMGVGLDTGLLLAEVSSPFFRPCALGSRQCDTEDETGCNRQPEREAALPAPTHSRGA